jgi:hypothetical protein
MLSQLGPEEQEQLLGALAQFAALPPEEQAALANRPPFEMAEAALLLQLDILFAALQSGQLENSLWEEAAGRITDISAQIAADESLGEGRRDLVTLLHCTAALLRQQEPPPIPAVYAAHWAEWTT